MKMRFALTIEDYYSYVGTDPRHYPTRDRVKTSLPSLLREKGYNLKFKRLNRAYTWYRIHISADVTEQELAEMHANNAIFMHKFENFSAKIIWKRPTLIK